MSNNHPTYNLKAVIHETGLTATTLRAWERRYGLFKPQRSPGGQRMYTQQEIDMLKWLVARQAEGLSISRAVALWRAQEENASGQSLPGPSAYSAAAAAGSATIVDHLRGDWLSACLAFNEPAAEQALTQALAIAPAEVVCTDVLQKGLAELGERWYAGTASVQQEHFASALAMRRLNALFAAAPAPTRPGRLLAVCPPGESHDFSLLILSFIMRWHGWDVVYLGANVPLAHLDDTLKSTTPSMVISVAQTLSGAAALHDLAGYVNSRSVPLAFGGGIFKHIPGLIERIPGYFLGEEMRAVPQVIDRLLSQQSQAPVLLPLPPGYAAALVEFKEKEALIVNTVREDLRNSPVDPRHLEVANIHLTNSIASVLALGEIDFLNYSVDWLEGLLDNYGLPTSLAAHYYATYRRAVQQHLGETGEIIVNWLAQVEPDNSF